MRAAHLTLVRRLLAQKRVGRTVTLQSLEPLPGTLARLAAAARGVC